MNTVTRGEPLRKKCLLLKRLLVIFILASSLLSGQTVGTKDVSVTAIEGESWLKHLHRSFNGSSMGRTWDLGPPPSMPGEESSRRQLELSPGYATQTLTLHGSDLSRLNCQG